jgi:hypothetical protein
MSLERPALERRIVAGLDAGRIPVLLGGCGTGRTSLLRRLAARFAPAAQYIDLAAVASTPERCLAAIAAATPFSAITATPAPGTATAEAAMAHLFDGLDRARGPAGEPATFLIDEFLDLRTFENFPGLRRVIADGIARWAASPNRFVLASRFTSRAHRVLRDAPARFEVIHMPALEVAEVEALARARDGRADWARAVAPAVHALSAGRLAYAAALVEGMAGGTLPDADTALADGFAPDGRLTALCRFSYELRLHRARGYGALKAILGVLAEEEPLTLTDIAHRLQRTPGSTKDYLSWLEDVDAVTVARKRYTFDDPLVRLFVRLYSGSVPPSAADIARETRTFAASRPSAPETTATPAPAAAAVAVAAAPVSAPRASGLIEID